VGGRWWPGYCLLLQSIVLAAQRTVYTLVRSKGDMTTDSLTGPSCLLRGGDWAGGMIAGGCSANIASACEWPLSTV